MTTDLKLPTEAPPRSLTIPVAITLLVLLVLGGGMLLIRAAEGNVNKVALADEPKGVTVVLARKATFRATHRFVGTLEPWLEARVGPQLASGYVDTVLVRPGSVVKRGDVLATLDCRNASTASQAVTLQARALEQRQKATTHEAARLGELLDGGFASPNEVEQKVAQSASNEAQIQALLAQAAGKSLEVNDCVLRAPFDGEVAARLADPGAFVRPGSPIAHVVDRSVVRLTANVSESDFDAVRPKTPAKIHVLSTGTDLVGEISRRAPSADPSTRTVHFEIDLSNQARTLPVGTTAEIKVDIGEEVPAAEIPLTAAKIRGKSAAVFVVEDGVAKKLSVPVLGERGGSLFLKPEALAVGAHVVTEGRSLLANNERVASKIDSARDTPTEEGDQAPSSADPPKKAE